LNLHGLNLHGLICMETKSMKWIAALIYLAAVSAVGLAQEVATEQVIGRLEIVATFAGAMPTGGHGRE
jgi:hypothetical protein